MGFPNFTESYVQNDALNEKINERVSFDCISRINFQDLRPKG
jgi:hypothetical protein|tara:strand:- start:296 stop:421 length:126 start_codon:yes stop_codon:yes gene_type:complete